VEGAVDTGQIAGNGSIAQRTAIYADWLAKQFDVDGAARITEVHLDSFRLTRVLRKAGSGDNGRRKTTNNAGPDVVFKGQLLVGDPPGFNRLLARGIGRHRAFGFGMLLLRPLGSC
jgi:CRISPR system Cascade subunit CasE